MRRTDRSRRRKRRYALMSIAIALIAAVGIGGYALMRQNNQEPADAAPVTGAEVDATQAPTAEPTEAPTPTPEPTKTPEPEPTPTPVPTPEPTPTPGPLDGLKIGIDPGHQQQMNGEKEPVSPGSKETKAKVSSGTRGVKTRVEEYVTDLEIALKLRDRLAALGAEIKMTREVNDVNISNVERAVMMNEWGADLVLRIHCNGVDSKSANGIGLYVKKTGERAEESYQAAVAIMPEMVKATGAREDGIFKRDTYSGLNWSTVPSILVECGYMSNPEEDVLLNDPEYQRQLADGIARGVAAYFDRGELPEMNEADQDDVPDLFAE